MTAQPVKSLIKWTRFVTALLLVGLLLPTNAAFAGPSAQEPNPLARRRPADGVRRPSPIESSVQATATGGNLIQDPSFEASFASTTYWKQSSTNFGSPLCTHDDCGDGGGTAGPRTGEVWSWFGGIDFTDPDMDSPEVANVYQRVAFPKLGCEATLQFYVWIGAAATGSDANDRLVAAIDGNTVFSVNATQKSSYPSYKLVSINVSSFANGGVRQVEFYTRVSDQLVTFNLDDVSLIAGKCAGAVRGDYNGDRKKDMAVFRPSNNTWYIRGVGPLVYGASSDIPAPADYNGDNKIDVAVFRESNGTWYLRGVGPIQYGQNNDIPVPADYDGNGTDEIAVFRPSNGTWYVRGLGPFLYGTNGDIPVVGDYNGDKMDDMAVFRPSNGTWYIRAVGNFVYGSTGDIPVPADYNGDGKMDLAVFRPSTGAWQISGGASVTYGQNGDIPVPGDYNGDGKAEIAVFRPSNGTWYIYGVGPTMYGTAGDIPV